MNHRAGRYSFFEGRHLSLFESTVLNGPTIAAGPVAVFGQRAQSDPLWKHKGLGPPPLRVITSDCGHKVSLQTFLKDEALPRNPLLASLHILSSLL